MQDWDGLNVPTKLVNDFCHYALIEYLRIGNVSTIGSQRPYESLDVRIYV